MLLRIVSRFQVSRFLIFQLDLARSSLQSKFLSKVLSPIQVFWHFSEVGWIKVNIVGDVRCASNFSTCSGISRDSHGD